jgi:hypothetical protein
MRFLILLLLGTLTVGFAQQLMVPPPYKPIRVYNLGNIDAVLVTQLARVMGTSHKCPYCVKRKVTSKVYLGMMVTDTLRVQAYFNEAGKLVAPDVNNVTTYLRCSRGDSWTEERNAGKKVVTVLSQIAP